MSQANIEIATRASSALMSGDLDTATRLVAEDCATTVVGRIGFLDAPTSYRSREALLSAIAGAKDVFAEFTWEVEERVTAGDWVIAVGRWRGRGKVSGVEVEGRSANAGRIHDGQLVELITGFPNRQAALEAVGLRE
jgi:ketosteroid isomerase-like protein